MDEGEIEKKKWSIRLPDRCCLKPPASNVLHVSKLPTDDSLNNCSEQYQNA